MRAGQLLPCFIALAAVACSQAPSLAPGAARVAVIPALHGRVEFGATAARQVSGSMVEIANAATVSLIDTTTGNTVATTRTDESGAFVLSFQDTGQLVPSGGDTYFLEAVKGLIDLGAAANRVGSSAARVRTLVTFQGGGWKSMAGNSVVLNRSTTALSAIAGLMALPAASTSALLGSLAVNQADGTLQPPTPDTFTPTAANGVSNQDYHTVFGLVNSTLGADLDPLASIAGTPGAFFYDPNQQWTLSDFRLGSRNGVTAAEAGYAQLSYAVAPAPLPNTANEDAYFPVQDTANAVGIVAADGTYLYAKCWGEYDAHDALAYVFKKVGSGFGGTVRGQNYGTVGPATWDAITAAAIPGWLFNTGGANNQLQRIDLSSGVMDTIILNDSLLSRHSGTTTDGGRYDFNTDGTYAYSISYAQAAGYDGFKVRVLDPAHNFTLVREFNTSPSGDSFYADGLFVDGVFLYPIEWTGGNARLRRYRLSDGQLEAEWTFPQTYTNNDPISGQWDWVNNKFWIGNLTIGSTGGSYIHQVKGGTFGSSGTFVSAPLDAGKPARLRALNWLADTPSGASVAFKLRSADSLTALAGAAWYGPTSTADSYSTPDQRLNAVLSNHRYVQLQATLTTTNTDLTPRLRWVRVQYQ